jgi:recombination protein RecA
MVKSTYTKKDTSALLDSINKDFGKGAVMLLSDAHIDVERVPTGALTLDLALGGGYPKGRIIEIYGDTGSAKTTVALHAIAEVQKLGGTAGFIDAEHALDPSYAKAIGVNVDELLLSQCDTGEMGLDICNRFVASNAVDIVVVDSVAALVPRAEIEGESGDSHVGLQARLMGQAMRKLTGVISKSNCIVIFINQERDLIGGYAYGPKTTTTGGKALKFFASIRLDVTRIQTLKKGNDEYGIRVKAKAVKNKVAAPYKVAEYDVIFGKGISTMGCLVDLAEELSIVKRKGAWYSYGEETNVAQGRDKLVQWLTANPEKSAEIESMVKMMLASDDVVEEEETLMEEVA